MSEINSFSDYTNKYNSNVDYSALFGGTSNSSSLGSTNILSDYASIKMEVIGEEFKQIGNSVANVGRLLTGKGTKEVSDEKEGVAHTRVLNMPVKKHISALKKQVERIDGAVAKLDKVCAGLDTGKNKEKSRVFVKEKLSQMKVKSEQQKKEQEKLNTKSKEECL